MKLKFYDWFVFGLLAVAAFNGGSTVALLAVIAGLLYLIVRRYFSASKIGKRAPSIISAKWQAEDSRGRIAFVRIEIQRRSLDSFAPVCSLSCERLGTAARAVRILGS